MKKIHLTFLFFSMLSGILLSCSDDDKYIPTPPAVSIENLSGEFAMPQGDSIILRARITSPLATTLSWSIKGNEVSTDSVYVFKNNELGQYEIKVTTTNVDGEASATASIEVHGKYKHGTLILNERSTLVFINPKGEISDSVYYRENGTKLGNTPQDLFIANNKMYIICQRGGEDGYLIVANAETMKKEAGYQDELEGQVSAPTHLAVLGNDDIYMRDNDGIKLFHPSTGALSLIQGTEGVRKNTMAVVDGKVFASVGSKVIVIEKGKSEISASIEFDAAVRGVIKSSDGNLWVSTSSGKISKVDAKAYSILKTNTLTDEAINSQSASFASTPCITAKGDTLYMSGTETKIYRHLFSQNATSLMVDAATMIENSNTVYNTVAVHPLTGEVYLNTLKGWGDERLINHISVFNFSGAAPRLSANYENHTDYPAGTFFTYNFE